MRQRKAQEKHTAVNQLWKDGALGNFNTTVKAITGNDQVHFNAAIDAATLGLVQFQTMMAKTSFAGGMGRGFAGSVSGAHFTEYGPGVPGDQLAKRRCDGKALCRP